MSFCIECGAKAPDVAKFCPQCGNALVAAETTEPSKKVKTEATTPAVQPKADKVKAKAAPVEEAPEVKAEAHAPDVNATKPTVTLPPTVVDPPNSKAGLLIGLSLIAILVAGAGAYATGLLGSSGDDLTADVSNTVSAASTNTQDVITEESAQAASANPTLDAYKAAITTGRISDLGQFAADHPDSSLAKDAQDAAFTSLQRQNSVLAFSTFTQFFPNAELSTYTGPRTNADTESNPSVVEGSTAAGTEVPPAYETPAVRLSITTRSEELNPFIEQGNTDYALSVVDEMQSLPDLNEAEATYLLNIRSRAQSAQGFAAPVAVAVTETVEIKTLDLEAGDPVVSDPPTPALVTIVPASAKTVLMAPKTETPDTVKVETVAPAETTVETPSFDTPAKPIERFGAITPEAATEPGECDMSFSVNTSGTPIYIIADCTDPIFVTPAVETVGEWSYEPATLAGVPVLQEGLSVKIRFHLDAEE